MKIEYKMFLLGCAVVALIHLEASRNCSRTLETAMVDDEPLMHCSGETVDKSDNSYLVIQVCTK